MFLINMLNMLNMLNMSNICLVTKIKSKAKCFCFNYLVSWTKKKKCHVINWKCLGLNLEISSNGCSISGDGRKTKWKGIKNAFYSNASGMIQLKSQV